VDDIRKEASGTLPRSAHDIAMLIYIIESHESPRYHAMYSRSGLSNQ